MMSTSSMLSSPVRTGCGARRHRCRWEQRGAVSGPRGRNVLTPVVVLGETNSAGIVPALMEGELT